MTTKATVTIGLGAQLLAQVLTACALAAHLLSWPGVSIWVVVPLIAAGVVPFRHDGTLHDRALGNFGAAVVVAGMVSWELTLGGLDGVLGGTGIAPIGAFTLLTTAAAALYAGAGAAFWRLRAEVRPH